ncbi:MAG: 4-hydroxy-tetrahydrodipicolinate reductase [Saprospiraceae bacterium]|jgi:4-hydroxy-tetrahydrodipicolinate reductase
MNIAIIGYGKMGKTIEKIALQRGHHIVMKIDNENKGEFTIENLKKEKVDLAIEFTNPESAFANITKCFEAGVKVICGSTAWLADWDKAIASLNEHKGTMIYASNFSVGVNIFFAVNKRLAELMDSQWDYDVSMKEIHHTSKVDAPSGTAITLSEGISEHLKRKSGWSKNIEATDKVHIKSVRVDSAPGTHKIKYSSSIDEIDIIHKAKSRDGFAQGAVMAAEFLHNKEGLFTMADVLGIG